jgi:hypothetical protein
LALDSRPLLRREFTAGLTRAGFIKLDLRFLPSEPRRFDPRQLAALNALPNPVSLVLLAFVDAVVGVAVLGVVLLLIDFLALPIQLALDSSPFLRREFAAGLTRAGFIKLDLRFLPSKPRGFNSGQLAAANALSNPLLLIVLTFVDAVPSSLSQASRRDYDGHHRRHHKPFHEPLFHFQLPPWPAAPGGVLKVNAL